MWRIDPEGARWPAYINTGYKQKRMRTLGETSIGRTINKDEEKMFKRIVRLEEITCRKLATRIHDINYCNGTALPEPASYICAKKPVTHEKSDLHANLHLTRNNVKAESTKLHYREQLVKFNVENPPIMHKDINPTSLADYLTGKTKVNPGTPYGIRVVKSVKKTLARAGKKSK